MLIRPLFPALILALAPALASAQSNEQLAQQVQIRRTSFGVPHILAQNYRALGFGLGYAQVEDYGARVVNGLFDARGQAGLVFGRDGIEGDYLNRVTHARAVETYHLIDPKAREI